LELIFQLQRYKIFSSFARFSSTLCYPKNAQRSFFIKVGSLGYLLGTSCNKRYPLRTPLYTGISEDSGTWGGLPAFSVFFSKIKRKIQLIRLHISCTHCWLSCSQSRLSCSCDCISCISVYISLEFKSNFNCYTFSIQLSCRTSVVHTF
jgi:hypothetical protein